MKTYRRDRLATALIAAILIALSGQGAWSQTTRTIRIVVPYPPASGPDILSRLLAEQIGRTQGPTVVSQLQSGRLRGLVPASRARVEPLPDVPTLAEAGVSKSNTRAIDCDVAIDDSPAPFENLPPSRRS